MRLLAALACALLLAGCASSATDEPAPTTPGGARDAARPTTAATPSKGTTTTTTTTTSPPTGTTTSPPSGETGPEEDNETTEAPPVVVASYNFAGSGPVDVATASPLEVDYAFAVPSGAVRILIYYNATYNGLWAGYASIEDAGGQEATNTIDACGIDISPGAQSRSECIVDISGSIGSGDWNIHYAWQLGNAGENFTFDVVVYGHA
jgi:hypothetical protein